MPRNDLASYPKKVGYRKHSGMVAWLLHRFTGVIIALYFISHILGSSDLVPFLSNVVRNVCVEGTIIILILFHALNGTRIILMEFCNSGEREKFKGHLYITFGLTAVLSVAAVLIILSARGA